MLNDPRVSITFENNNVWLIHRRQVDIPNLNNAAMVDLMRRHTANRSLGAKAADRVALSGARVALHGTRTSPEILGTWLLSPDGHNHPRITPPSASTGW